MFETLKANTGTLVFLAILLIGVPIKIAKSVYDFYDEYVLHRRYRRIILFLENCGDANVLKEFLSTLKETEVFRISTGISTSPLRARALMKLFNMGNITSTGLKGASKYLTLEANSELKLCISKFDRIFAYYGLASSILIFLMGALLPLSILQSRPNYINIILALTTFAFIVLISRIMNEDYRAMKYAESLDLTKGEIKKSKSDTQKKKSGISPN